MCNSFNSFIKQFSGGVQSFGKTTNLVMSSKTKCQIVVRRVSTDAKPIREMRWRVEIACNDKPVAFERIPHACVLVKPGLYLAVRGDGAVGRCVDCRQHSVIELRSLTNDKSTESWLGQVHDALTEEHFYALANTICLNLRRSLAATKSKSDGQQLVLVNDKLEKIVKEPCISASIKFVPRILCTERVHVYFKMYTDGEDYHLPMGYEKRIVPAKANVFIKFTNFGWQTLPMNAQFVADDQIFAAFQELAKEIYQEQREALVQPPRGCEYELTERVEYVLQ